MGLVDQFIDLAERDYSLDWNRIQCAVAEKLGLKFSFEALGCGPRQLPSYWYVPILVGNYVGASKHSVLRDTEAFVTGCVVRHFILDLDKPYDSARVPELIHSVKNAYTGCLVESRQGLVLHFEDRFSAKCLPWLVLLGVGTQSIGSEADGEDYASVMRTIFLVHSCLQMIDDWHDRTEDVNRSHWNMWIHATIAECLSVIEPLLRGSLIGVERLRPHLLRRILNSQLQDTSNELNDVLTVLNGSSKTSDSAGAACCPSVIGRTSDGGH